MQDDIKRFISGQLESRTLTRCSRYTEKVRVMGQPFPGPWSFDYFPWLRQMHDDDSDVIFIQKGCQLGVTEYAINRTIYTLDVLKRAVLYALPNQIPDASNFSKGRLNPITEMSPYLSTLFSKARSETLKQTHAGVCLYITGSNSEKAMREKPCSLVIGDEINQFSSKSVELAQRRLDGQPEGKRQFIGLSTPTIEGKGIDKLFKDTKQNHFFFTCPHCSKYIELSYPECFVVIGESILDPRLSESHFICPECKHKLDHTQKPEYFKSGIWVPKYPDRPWQGYYINQLYSFAMQPKTLAEYELKSRFDVVSKQEFYNSSLGITFSATGSKLSDQEINDAQKDYFNNDMSRKGHFYTCGFDIGQLTHHCCIVRWKIDPSMGRNILAAASGELAYYGTVSSFEEIESLMQKWKPRQTVLDAQPDVSSTIELCKKFSGIANRCYYSTGKAVREISHTEDENKISVNRTVWLDATIDKIRTKTLALPKDTSMDLRDHLMSSVKVYSRDNSGNTVAEYVKKDDEPDHFLHSLNYAVIALGMAGGGGQSQVG